MGSVSRDSTYMFTLKRHEYKIKESNHVFQYPVGSYVRRQSTNLLQTCGLPHSTFDIHTPSRRLDNRSILVKLGYSQPRHPMYVAHPASAARDYS